MLNAKNISKQFVVDGSSVPVLKGISMTVEEGDFLAIVGRSGSGKTTFLNVLSTLVKPDQGELLYQKK